MLQYTLTGALNHKQFKSNLQRISNIRPFNNQYNWTEINFPWHKKDWKKFELNKKSITNKIVRSLNIILADKKYDVVILTYYIFDFIS